MKYIVILFSFYLVALTLIPCGDESDVRTTESVSYSSQKDAMGLEHKVLDDCAPFCSCNCCSFGKHFPLQITKKLIEPLAQITYAMSSISAVKMQPIAIWQPPKLA